MKTELEQAIEACQLDLTNTAPEEDGLQSTTIVYSNDLSILIEAAKRTAEVEKDVERLGTQLHDEQLAHRVTSERYQSSLDQLQSQAEDVKKMVERLNGIKIICKYRYNQDQLELTRICMEDCDEALSTPTAQKYLKQ